MAADSSTAMVEQSTKIGGTLLAVPTPFGAEIDLLEVLAGGDDGEQHVDAGEVGRRSTILPPTLASGSALARVRFQIDTS